MKNLIMKNYYLGSILVLLGSITTFSQTPEQQRAIIKNYDQEKLEELRIQHETIEETRKKEALLFAKEKGWDQYKENPDGSYDELMAVSRDGHPIYYTVYNTDAARSTRTNHLNIGGSLGLNLDGQNMTAYVWDGGPTRMSHQEFDGPGGFNRVSINDGLYVLNNISFHAQHVTGTILAAGIQPAAKGMAPQAKALTHEWNFDLSEATAAAANGMLLSNHSYGLRANQIPDWYFGAYLSWTRDWDDLMHQAPYYLMVVAAGNDGNDNASNGSPLSGMADFDKLSWLSTAKNNLVVANAQDANVNDDGSLNAVAISGSSSEGPTDDYRIKPDITGNGTGVYSTYDNSNSAYNTISGTSMATPNVTGSLLLLQQHYNNINGNFMRAATLKGLALHTADDAGIPGPDAVFGWGLLNAKEAAATISQDGSTAIVGELSLADGDSYTFNVDADGSRPLVISISWTDPPGTPNQGTVNQTVPVLVNDLDVRVTQNGTTYVPYRLTGVNTNGTGDNAVDPYEKIIIENASGTYAITVNHKGSLSGGNQKFSLITTGVNVNTPVCSAVAPSGLTASDLSQTTASISWNAVSGTSYDIRYRAIGTSTWNEIAIDATTIPLNNLNHETEYEVQVRSKCSSNSISSYSPSTIFTTNSQGFITTWQVSSNGGSITIPTNQAFTNYAYTVDWGDGTTDNTTYIGNASHIYATAGTYQIQINGSFPAIYFNNTGDNNKILTIEQWGNIDWESMEASFFGCSNLTSNATDTPDLILVSSMASMFRNASSFNGDISSWEVNSVSDMQHMFDGATAFNQNIGEWRVGNVSNMQFMFSDASTFNQNLRKWNVGSVTNMAHMFTNASAFNQYLGDWDVSYVTDMQYMLDNTALSTTNYDITLIKWAQNASLQLSVDLGAGGLNYCNSTTARNTLNSMYSWTFTGDAPLCRPFISTWETSTSNETITIPTSSYHSYSYTVNWGDGHIDTYSDDATHAYSSPGIHTVEITGNFPTMNFFANSSNSDKILTIEQWGDISWESMNWAFYGCSNLTSNATDAPNLSDVTSAVKMFFGASNFNGDINSWDVGNIKNMREMFYGASSFNQNLDSWNVSEVEDMTDMFRDATAFNGDISSWDVSGTTKMSYMFFNAISFDQDLGNWDVSEVTTMAYMFNHAEAFDQDVGNWDVGNVKQMQGMFSNASSFNQDIGSWDVSGVNTMQSMFSNAQVFNQDIGGWSVGNINNMQSMFRNAFAFDQDLGDWDISNVTNMLNMLRFTGLSTTNYDLTLIGWATIEPNETGLQSNVNLSISPQNLTYCEAAAAREELINTYGWTISGDQLGCNSFITTWETTAIDESVTIPTNIAYDYLYLVDWGDGNSGIYTGDASHTYNNPGIHTVEIIGRFPAIHFNNQGDKDKIQSIEQWGDIKWESVTAAYYGCSNLTINGSDVPKLSQVTSTENMFRNAQSLNADLGHWDISSITNMSNMLDSSGLSSHSYDATLQGWSSQLVQPNVSLGAAGLIYCDEAINARNQLINGSYWSIHGDKLCKAFITTWETTSMNESITIPTSHIRQYDYKVHWGDGNTGYYAGDATHTYSNPGLHTVEITGDFPAILFDGKGDKDKILTIEQWGDPKWESMEFAFSGCTNLVSNAIDAPDLRNTFSTAAMFKFATAFDGDLSLWNVSSVENMNAMFFNASSFNGDVSTWNVQSVDNMSHMFKGASSFDQNLENWSVDNVTNMSSMFSGASSFNQNIGGWMVHQVNDMSNMFTGATSFNRDIGDWDVSIVGDMSYMFSNATSFDQDIGSWDVSNVTNMSGMLINASSFNQNIGDWNISNVSNMMNMLNQSGLSQTSYDQTLIGWSTISADETGIQPNVILTALSLAYCDGLVARDELMNLHGWNIYGDLYECKDAFITTWVTTIANESITIPTSPLHTYAYTVNWGDGHSNSYSGDATHSYNSPGIHTIEITGDFPAIYFNNQGDKDKILTIEQWGNIPWKTMENAFFGCTNVTSNATDAPNLNQVTSTASMFRNASNFEGELNQWDVGSIENMTSMFFGASLFNQDISDWNVENVINMSYMFHKAFAFNQAIGDWEVDNVTSMAKMFASATSFNQNIGSWKVGSVKDMSGMFLNATSFNQVIEKWDVGSVNRMDYMFFRALAFNQSIDDWDIVNVNNMQSMFYYAYSFDQSIGTWDISNVGNMRDMLDHSGLSTSNYDETLIGWSTFDANENGPRLNVTLGATGLTYCHGEMARGTLANTYGWDISGDIHAPNNCSPFITTWVTTTDTESITIPTSPTLTYAYTVDWGDGKVGTYTGDATHTYVTPGTQTIEIRGNFPSIYFNNQGDKNKIATIEQWGDVSWESMANAFDGCINLISNSTDTPDLGKVTSTSSMFRNASIFNENLSSWDVSNVTNMAYMFSGASSFNQNIENWSVENVTDMTDMFANASTFNQYIGDWDISSVTNMSGMLDNTALSTANYDDTLIGWANTTGPQSNVTLGANGLDYCGGAAARNVLVNTYSWTITGDLLDPSCSNQTIQMSAQVLNSESPLPDSLTEDGVKVSTEFSKPTIYPNPAYHGLNVSSGSAGDVIEVLNLAGVSVYSKIYPKPGKRTLKVDGLSPGIYFIKIQSDGTSHLMKFVKK